MRVLRPDLGYRQNGAYSMKNGETTRRSEGGGVSIARPEHRLNIIKLGLKIQDENAVNSIARKRPTRTLLSLFAIESHFGKLAFIHYDFGHSSFAVKAFDLLTDVRESTPSVMQIATIRRF